MLPISYRVDIYQNREKYVTVTIITFNAYNAVNVGYKSINNNVLNWGFIWKQMIRNLFQFSWNLCMGWNQYFNVIIEWFSRLLQARSLAMLSYPYIWFFYDPVSISNCFFFFKIRQHVSRNVTWIIELHSKYGLLLTLQIVVLRRWNTVSFQFMI